MKRTLSIAAALAAVLLAAPALAGTPAAGVPQQIRTGFFADVNVGGFFTVGGQNSRAESRPSNAQLYLQLGVGYDIAKNFAVAANFGLGSSAASCFSQVDGKGNCVLDASAAPAERVLMADNFTVTMFTVEGAYKVAFTDRLTLQPRLHLGYAMLEPEPLKNANGDPIKGGVVVGGGAGIEYATHMDHFSIGADLYARLITGPNIVSMAFYPKIKYTF